MFAKKRAARLTAAIIRRNVLPNAAKYSLARWILTRSSGSFASSFIKVFAESQIVTGAGPSPNLVQELERTQKSLIRFGDGEALALLGKPVWFQSPAAEIRRDLFDAYFHYGNDSSYLLCAPSQIFLSAQDIQLADNGKLWRNSAKLRGLEALARLLNLRDAPVFDSNAFRSNQEDPSVLWSQAVDVVVISNARVFAENQQSRAFKAARLHHVEVPEVEVLPHLKRICEEVDAMFSKHFLEAANTPVLVAAGAAGKLLVLRLMSRYRVLDLGAFLGWSIERSQRPSLHVKKSELR
jgi:hypothetical protein